jgi:hypothetical protein
MSSRTPTTTSVEFAHCEDTFPPPQANHPEWAGYDQIDERGFFDAA